MIKSKYLTTTLGSAFVMIFLTGEGQALTAIDVGSSLGLPSGLPSHGESVVFKQHASDPISILLSAHGREWPLLRQDPVGHFRPVLAGTFASGKDRHSCTTADFNKDGNPDIYCVRGACKGICGSPYPNELYLGRADGTFQKIDGAWGADDPHGRGRGALALDYDNDQKIDLLVINEKSTRFPTIGNHLFHNAGNRFVEVTSSPVANTIGTLTATTIAKENSLPDLAMETARGVMYYSDNGGNYGNGRLLGGSDAFDVDSADLNGDRRPDLVIVRSNALEVRLNSGNYYFSTVNYTTPLSQGRNVALCQLDGRSGLDIYVTQGVRPANQDFILLNNGSGAAFTKLPVPRVAKGHGDVASCVPGFPGGLGDSVLVTNNKWLSSGDPRLGPTRLVQVRN